MTNSAPIRVLIVDDQPVVRSGLVSFLALCEDIVCVGEARNGEVALDQVERLCPDVVLLDLMMPGMDGAACARAIHEHWPAVRMLALTSFAEPRLVQEVMQAGVTGYLLKDVSTQELAQAIRAAFAGKPTLAPEAAQVLLTRTRGADQPLGADLSARERDVLRLLVEGNNNQDIAADLGVSVYTIKAHVSNILSKLGAATRTEAVTLALKHKLLSGGR